MTTCFLSHLSACKYRLNFVYILFLYSHLKTSSKEIKEIAQTVIIQNKVAKEILFRLFDEAGLNALNVGPLNTESVIKHQT